MIEQQHLKTSIHQRYQSIYQRLQSNPYVPVLFFIGGFIFDILLLDRIDGLLQFVQVIAYTLILSILVRFAVLERGQVWTPKGFIAKYWKYNEFLIHFLLGALLNLYSIFYFKSASFLSSILFIGIIAGLLLINEFLRVERFQHLIIFILYYVCIVSFWIAFVPIVLGFVGFVPFLLGLVLAGAMIWLFDASLIHNKQPVQSKLSVRRFNFRVGSSVILFFLIFYALQLIPPVPLSINYMGIFHDIKKVNGEYQLTHYRPNWRLWENGDQNFKARAGDKIVAYVEIFAPSRFKDEIKFRWLLKTKSGWQPQDLIPITIVGGRDQGFRGYTIKQNYQPGDYRVSVVTTDDREVGRINITITTDQDILPRESQVLIR